MSKITTAVIPLAGFGTRMFPSTFFINKAFLPIGKKPIILHLIEEAYEANITNFIIIVNNNQINIKNLLVPFANLENNPEVIKYNKLINSINIKYIIQEKQIGLADALLCAKDQIKNEYFSVLLGDCAFIKQDKEYGINNLIKKFNNLNATYIGLTKIIDINMLKAYGVIDGKHISDDLILINNIIEKPTNIPPSNLICAGRYIFNRSILEIIESLTYPNEELLLPNVINHILKKEKVYGVTHSTKWLDVGNELEFIKSNIFYGLSNQEYNKEIKNILY